MSADRYPRWAMVGALGSRTADEMSGTALLLLALAATGRVGAGAAAVGSLTISAAIGGPLLGVLLDRSRHGLAIALGLYGVGLIGCALALHAGLTVLAALVALVAGLLGPAVAGGWSGMLTSTDRQRGRRLAAFDAASYSLASLIGPLIAGVAYALGGASTPVVVTVVLLGFGTCCAVRAATRRATADRDRSAASALGDMVDGIRTIWHDRPLRAVTSASCIGFVGFGMLSVAVPLLGAERLGSAGNGTILLALMAAAALAAAAAADRLDLLSRPGPLFVAGTVLVAAGLLVMTVPTRPAALIAAALIGLGDGPQLAALIQVRHLRAPARLRTQIFTTGASLKISAAGAGAYLAGALGSDDPTLFTGVAAGLYLVAAIAVLPGLPGLRAERTGMAGNDRI
ncbi:MAG: MFS transporter [Nocardioides sp.]|uniref:MFS transporter n=1 Tax=Nocardioides sp. TaxID=35761 RepID=UPI0039E3647C